MNVRTTKRQLSGYNIFVREHGFKEASRVWNLLDSTVQRQYNDMARTENCKRVPVREPTPARKINSWTAAIQEWNRRRGEDRSFAPIRKGTRAYAEIKTIQKNLTDAKKIQ